MSSDEDEDPLAKAKAPPVRKKKRQRLNKGAASGAQANRPQPRARARSDSEDSADMVATKEDDDFVDRDDDDAELLAEYDAPQQFDKGDEADEAADDDGALFDRVLTVRSWCGWVGLGAVCVVVWYMGGRRGEPLDNRGRAAPAMCVVTV